ncbi:MAG: carbon-nitrogen hydrolase family protein [Candidatus Izimaplasma sp.]|nr:carbon-nitrogen hydrolase family protein [Candidatus Izimaplasma bacterium]
MKVTLVQSDIKETKEENIAHIKRIIPDDLQTDILVLPEMFVTPYQNDYFAQNAIQKNDEDYKIIASIAKQYSCYLIAGSVPEKRNNTLYNTTFVFDKTGKEIARYAKRHLFKVTYPSGKTYDESDILSAGDSLAIVDTEFGKIGLMICFDIRFPLLAKKYQEQGVKMIIVPAAFNTYTGPLHWHLTFRARAVDNQLFMVGVSQSRDSFGTYEPYGHSLVVGPLGHIISECQTAEAIQTIDVDLADIKSARQSIPIVNNQKIL